ncbi:hypothetical protein [Flavobacterium humi]|uniref:Uncharacterized protein n=1 Tax=Flavobacterium humi TaxID=2562683 RepID=A0A4Z0LCB3_9FLAO|nr:hypothetical protein [Flavobacterium humi]TGD59530.1 hypothetical protein E4635_00935 [Flavobacterium humi]
MSTPCRNNRLHKAVQTIHVAVQTVHKAVQTIHKAVQTVHVAVQTIHVAVQTVHKAMQTIHMAVQTIRMAVQTIHMAVQTIHMAVQKYDSTYALLKVRNNPEGLIKFSEANIIEIEDCALTDFTISLNYGKMRHTTVTPRIVCIARAKGTQYAYYLDNNDLNSYNWTRYIIN